MVLGMIRAVIPSMQHAAFGEKAITYVAVSLSALGLLRGSLID
jgi:hypothetical protein